MKRITKKQKIIAIVAFIILISLAFVFFIKRKNQPKSLVNQYCFVNNERGEHIKIFINKKTNTVNGSKNTKDYQGILLGNQKDGQLNLQYEYTLDGTRIKEKEIYTLSILGLTKKVWPTSIFGGIITPDQTKNYKKVIYTKESCSITSRNQPFSLFTNKEKTISFVYPKNFSVDKKEQNPTKDWSFGSKYDGKILATMSIPKTFQPNTNFSEAKFTIRESADSGAFQSCLAKEDELGSIFSDETIGFTTYLKSTTNDAGAGNFYETTTYKIIKNRKCYSFQYTIHSTNIGNYSPEQNITEFDKAKIVNIFEGMMKTVKFL